MSQLQRAGLANVLKNRREKVILEVPLANNSQKYTRTISVK